MIALPKLTPDNRVTCISKTPITNRQYKQFVQETGYPEPQELSNGVSPAFRPWQDRRFNRDDQPVVCVSYFDAVEYCRWANKRLRAAKRRFLSKLPTTRVWDLAAFGTEWPSWDPDIWHAELRWPRSRTKAPFVVIPAPSVNERGIVPMLGNVWEWCAVEWGRYTWDRVPANLEDWKYPGEIRGGSFLEDLRTASEPKLQFDQFPNGINAKDSDIGFRIASEIQASLLPADLRARLPKIRRKKKMATSRRMVRRWRHLKKK
jgi:formylglycine-generating enzyme required for sulfatase activity